jgi:hypothetical protein
LFFFDLLDPGSEAGVTNKQGFNYKISNLHGAVSVTFLISRLKSGLALSRHPGGYPLSYVAAAIQGTARKMEEKGVFKFQITEKQDTIKFQ